MREKGLFSEKSADEINALGVFGHCADFHKVPDEYNRGKEAEGDEGHQQLGNTLASVTGEEVVDAEGAKENGQQNVGDSGFGHISVWVGLFFYWENPAPGVIPGRDLKWNQNRGLLAQHFSALLEQLGAGSVNLGAGEFVDGQTLNDAVGAVRIGAGGLGADDAGGQTVLGAVGVGSHGEPVALGGGGGQVLHSHQGGVGCGGSGGKAAGLDDGGAALLHGLDEVGLEPFDVGDDLGHGLATNLGVGEVRVLGGGVVAPDGHVGHLGHVHTGLGSQLALGAVFIELGHGEEVLLGQTGSVVQGDEAVGVAGVAHHEHAAAGGGVLGDSLALAHEYLAVDGEQVLALHTGLAGHGTHQHAPVGILESHSGIIGSHDFLHQREGAVLELHHHALQLLQAGGDFEELQNHGLISTQHLTSCNAEQKGIGNVAGGAGHGHSYGFLHNAEYFMQYLIRVNPKVCVGLLRSHFFEENEKIFKYSFVFEYACKRLLCIGIC